MLILAALVLATTIAETPCDQSFSEVLRTELAVFLEPSDSNRKKSTKRIIKTLLVPLHDDLVHARCAKAIACALADFGTPRLVDRALKAESEFYRSVAWGPRTNRGIPDPTATLADTRDLLILSDELAGCAKRSVREDLPEGLTDPDPRHWEAQAIARQIVKMRREQFAVLHGPHSSVAPRQLAPMFSSFPLRLMGLKRVRNLLEGSKPLPQTETFSLVPAEHFPDENALYRREWDALPSGDTSEHHLWYFEEYSRARWNETDEAAPHSDLEAITKAVEELEKERAP